MNGSATSGTGVERAGAAACGAGLGSWNGCTSTVGRAEVSSSGAAFPATAAFPALGGLTRCFGAGAATRAAGAAARAGSGVCAAVGVRPPGSARAAVRKGAWAGRKALRADPERAIS